VSPVSQKRIGVLSENPGEEVGAMGEGETKPKSNKSKDWIDYADKKKKQFVNYHTDKVVNIGPRSLGLGFGKRKVPLSDDYSRVLSQNELEARSKGMELKRQESQRSGMEKGGKVRATGKRTLHKGEMVARKTSRAKCRGGRR
jgi:hypothetical protein